MFHLGENVKNIIKVYLLIHTLLDQNGCSERILYWLFGCRPHSSIAKALAFEAEGSGFVYQPEHIFTVMKNYYSHDNF